jgi:hypothetical protein
VIARPADWTPEEVFADFEERAGIMEYEGGMSREDAERLAWERIRVNFGVGMMAKAWAIGDSRRTV